MITRTIPVVRRWAAPTTTKSTARHFGTQVDTLERKPPTTMEPPKKVVYELPTMLPRAFKSKLQAQVVEMGFALPTVEEVQKQLTPGLVEKAKLAAEVATLPLEAKPFAIVQSQFKYLMTRNAQGDQTSAYLVPGPRLVKEDHLFSEIFADRPHLLRTAAALLELVAAHPMYASLGGVIGSALVLRNLGLGTGSGLPLHQDDHYSISAFVAAGGTNLTGVNDLTTVMEKPLAIANDTQVRVLNHSLSGVKHNSRLIRIAAGPTERFLVHAGLKHLAVSQQDAAIELESALEQAEVCNPISAADL